MDYREAFAEENAEVKERYELALERIQSIRQEETVQEPFLSYFRQAAEIVEAADKQRDLDIRRCMQYTEEVLERQNLAFYEELLPEQYEHSYANPQYAVRVLGEAYGAMLSFLYTELRGCHIYARESRMQEMTIFMELLIEIYILFDDAVSLTTARLQKVLYYLYYD